MSIIIGTILRLIRSLPNRSTPNDGDMVPIAGTDGETYTRTIGSIKADLVSGVPAAHATSHKHSGSDEVSTPTPAAYAIPQALASGLLDVGWVDLSAKVDSSDDRLGSIIAIPTIGDPATAVKLSVNAAQGVSLSLIVDDGTTAEISVEDATTSTPGVVKLAPNLGTTAGTVVQADDTRLLGLGGGGGGSTFTPQSVTSARLRLELVADNIRATSGDAIPTYYDTSGYARTFSDSGSPSIDPILAGGVANGRAAIQFTADTHYLQGVAASPDSAISDGTGWTIIAAINMLAAPVRNSSTPYSNDAIVVHENEYWGLLARRNPLTDDSEIGIYNWHSAAQEVWVSMTIGADEWHVAVAHLDSATHLLSIALDGGTPITIASGTTDDTTNHVRLGQPGKTALCYLPSVYIFGPGMSSGDIDSMVTYLQTYYRLI